MIKINKLNNFGPIKNINKPIIFKNLTIFMGDNSAGKSYLAMLVHSFTAMTKGYEDEDFLKAVKSKFKNVSIVKKLNKVFETFSEQDDFNIDIYFDEEDIKEIKKIIKFSINDYLINRYLLPRIFTHHIQIEDIDIDIENLDKYMIQNISLSKKSNDDIIEIAIKFNTNVFNVRFLGMTDKNFVKEKMYNNIMSKLIYLPIKNSFPTKCEYLPASRTGYLQTYKHLASIAINNLSSVEMTKNNQLSLLTTWFLSQLNNATSYNSSKLTDYIEKTILHGKVNLFENNNNIEFELDNGNKVDINYLSSTISELIPLVVFLKRGFIVKNGMLVIEEPEAHLSFKNQKLMASLITLLIKENIRVIITTHSDFLIYELNNLILKHEIINSTKFNQLENLIRNNTYLENEEKDLLNTELKNISNDEITLNYKHVKVYNFNLGTDNSSVIDEVKISYGGISSDYIKNITFQTSKEKNLLLDMLELYL